MVGVGDDGSCQATVLGRHRWLANMAELDWQRCHFKHEREVYMN
jgi:hypothetical protein